MANESPFTQNTTQMHENEKEKFDNFGKFENRVHVKKKSLVYLWSFLLCYLTLGAVIISKIEQNREVSN